MRSVPRVRTLAALAALALGLGLAGNGRSAQAQWGWGYGFGGFGGGYGYGGYGGYGEGMAAGGMSIYDAAAMREQAYMMNGARYNAMNAYSNQANQQAYLMQQQAYNTALQNERLSMELAQQKYDIEKQNLKSYEAARAAEPVEPITQFINPDGQIQWPEGAPNGGAHATRRQAVDAAVGKAASAYRTSSRVNVADIVNARRALYAYGQPALDLLGTRRDARNRAELLTFLRSFDRTLEHLTLPPETAANAAAPAGNAPAPPAPGTNVP